jgi:hypothetical protein
MTDIKTMTLDEFAAVLYRGGYIYDRTEAGIDVRAFITSI